MGWTWTSYANRCTNVIIKNPLSVSVLSTLFAFDAGAAFDDLKSKTGSTAHHWEAYLFLFGAIWLSYLMARTVRQLRGNNSNTSDKNQLA